MNKVHNKSLNMYDDTYHPLSLQLCTKSLLIGLFLHALGYMYI